MSRPTRILLYSTLFPSASRPGHGIFVETRLRELLKSSPIQARVVAPVPWFPSRSPRFGAWAAMARTPAREVRGGVDVLHPRYPILPRLGMTMAPISLALASIPALRQVRAEGFDFDVIDAHYYYPDGVAATLLARWFHRPVTITARGTDLNLIPSHALPRRMIQWAARHADASIGVCAALIDVLRGWGIDEHRLHVFRNGVDLERFAPLDPGLARAQLGINGGPILLSVGHLVENKGHHIAIDVLQVLLAKYPQAQLIVVGEGPERHRLEAQAVQRGLRDRVRLVGSVPNDRLSPWYSAADVMILASSREGWANVLLESLACGTPVVATRVGGIPEVLAASSWSRLVDSRSAPAFADAVLSVLDVPVDRRAVRAYAERFSWRATSEAQHLLFERLAKDRCATC